MPLTNTANLTFIDWLIMLVYFIFVLGIGFALKRYMRTSNDFFLAGRSIPAWVCGLAFISANLGAQEVIGMGASGAKYGIITSHFYWIGAIPAMVFVGIFMMPFYYGSKARSVPEYLRMRFDEKTRALNAFSFAVMTVFSSGISMYAMALLIQTLGLFHGIIPDAYIFHVSIVLSAVIVLGYIFLGGLTSAIYNEVLQFFLIVAGFAPLVWIGLHNVSVQHGGIGGWAAIKQTLPATMTHSWHGMAKASTNTLGVEWVGLAMGLGFVLSFGYWCTDFLVIQRAMAADSEVSARRVPLIAAIPKMFFPFLVILPGIIAVSVTSHMAGAGEGSGNQVGMSQAAKASYSETVAAAAAAHTPLDEFHPHGIIPQKIDPINGNAVLSADGTPVYNYDLAIPVMLLHYFPTGILGLGLTALLASFMSGMAGNVTAFNTVWTYDIYQAYINKKASDAHYLWMGRMATVGGIILSIAAAYAATSFNNIMDALQLIFSLVNAPLFATFLLGMFWKRTTGHGAFTGLLAGTGAALLHHGLTLPADATPGIHGAWLHLIHTYPSDMAQNFWTAIFAFTVNLIVTAIVSLMTAPRPEPELVGLVYLADPEAGRYAPGVVAEAFHAGGDRFGDAGCVEPGLRVNSSHYSQEEIHGPDAVDTGSRSANLLPYYAPVNPIATPAKVFGIIHAVLALLALVGSFSLGAIASLSGLRGANPAGMLFPILTAIVLISAVLNAATAYGLLARRSWGRMLLIVTSILSLISIPIGTILGGVALYFFMRNGAEQDYARLTLGQP